MPAPLKNPKIPNPNSAKPPPKLSAVDGEANTKVIKQARKQASRQASKQTNQTKPNQPASQPNQPASQPNNQLTDRPTGNPNNKQASNQTKQANKQTSKQTKAPTKPTQPATQQALLFTTPWTFQRVLFLSCSFCVCLILQRKRTAKSRKRLSKPILSGSRLKGHSQCGATTTRLGRRFSVNAPLRLMVR